MSNISKLNIDGDIRDIKDSAARSDINTIKNSLKVVSTASNGLAPKVTNTSGFLKGDGTWANIDADNTTYEISKSGSKIVLTGSDGSSSEVIDSDTTYSAATTAANGLMSSTDKSKLDGIAEGAQVNTITGVKGDAESSYRTGDVNITPANIGAVATSEKGAASGVVPLNASSLIDSKYLPSYVDDVLEYASRDAFPTTGESGKIYVDTSAEENNTYRWSGSTYILIAKNTDTTYKISKSGSTITLTGSDGSTTTVTDSDTTYAAATTAADGLMSSSDKSKLENIPSDAEANQNAFSNVVVGSTTVAAGSETDSITLAGSNVTITPSATDKKITIGITKDNVTGALGYTPPTSNTTYAVVSSSADGLAPKVTNTAAFLKGDGTWATPTNTTYSAATTSTNGLMSSSDKIKLNGIDTGANKTVVDSALSTTSTNPVQNSVVATALNGKAASSHSHTTSDISDFPTIPTVNDPKVTIVQAGTTKATFTLNQSGATTVSLTDSNTTYGTVSTTSSGLAPKVTSTAAYLRGDGNWATPTNTTYSAVSTSANGLAPKVTNTAAFLKGDGTWAIPTNTTYGTVSTSANGLAPKATSTAAYLRGDGTWSTPTDTTYAIATTLINGLMSNSDKTKLDGIAKNANNYTLPNATTASLGGVKIGSNITVSSGTISLTKTNVTDALGYTPTTYGASTTAAIGMNKSAYVSDTTLYVF